MVGGGVALLGASYWTLCDNLAGLADFMEVESGWHACASPEFELQIRRALFGSLGGFDRASRDHRVRIPIYASGCDAEAIPCCSSRVHVLRTARRVTVFTTCWAHFHMFGADYLIFSASTAI